MALEILNLLWFDPINYEKKIMYYSSFGNDSACPASHYFLSYDVIELNSNVGPPTAEISLPANHM